MPLSLAVAGLYSIHPLTVVAAIGGVTVLREALLAEQWHIDNKTEGHQRQDDGGACTTHPTVQQTQDSE